MNESLIKIAQRNGLSVDEAIYFMEQGLEKVAWTPASKKLGFLERLLAEKALVDANVTRAEALANIFTSASQKGLVNKGNLVNKVDFGNPKDNQGKPRP